MVKIKQQKKTMEEKLNTLRAGVLGSNDGILTVVGVLVSVAAATTDRFTIFIAGLSDLLACAFSMASGEYASVSTQKDTEKSAVAQEEKLLKTFCAIMDMDEDTLEPEEFRIIIKACQKSKSLKDVQSRRGKTPPYQPHGKGRKKRK